MDTLMLVYLVCFGVGLVFTIISAFMADVFGGHDVHVDLGGGHDGAGGGTHAEGGFASHEMPGFSPLSPTVIASFLTAFGGIGLVLSRIESTRSVLISAPLSIVGGFVIAALIFWMFDTVFRRTQGSSESRVATLSGMAATIITPIAPHGVGEIAYVQSGTRYTAPARCESNENLTNGEAVIITRVVGTQFYVTRVNA